jgi:uncharacterized membrane protein YozB (DUF420 family)
MNLPALNASLNLTSAVLLGMGYGFIRTKRIGLHRLCMVSAFVVSMSFLVSYVVYHLHAGHVPYRGQGVLRRVYFSILASHTVLAVVIVPLVLRTLYLAVKGRFEDHRRWARWTLPIWFYVSVTGVVIYEMLY